jgi:hypothetical protein
VTASRAALALLFLAALAMSVNYVSATVRFFHANQAYDLLEPTLEDFRFTNADEPVLVEFGLVNPSSIDIEILQIRVTLRAGLQIVGGGTLQVDEMLPAGEFLSYRIPATISDRNTIRSLEGEQISWLLSGEVQVRLDPDIDPAWMNFRVRTETQ